MLYANNKSFPNLWEKAPHNVSGQGVWSTRYSILSGMIMLIDEKQKNTTVFYLLLGKPKGP